MAASSPTSDHRQGLLSSVDKSGAPGRSGYGANVAADDFPPFRCLMSIITRIMMVTARAIPRMAAVVDISFNSADCVSSEEFCPPSLDESSPESDETGIVTFTLFSSHNFSLPLSIQTETL